MILQEMVVDNIEQLKQQLSAKTQERLNLDSRASGNEWSAIHNQEVDLQTKIDALEGRLMFGPEKEIVHEPWYNPDMMGNTVKRAIEARIKQAKAMLTLSFCTKHDIKHDSKKISDLNDIIDKTTLQLSEIKKSIDTYIEDQAQIFLNQEPKNKSTKVQQRQKDTSWFSKQDVEGLAKALLDAKGLCK